MGLRALTFDYWDTLYSAAALPEAMHLRQAAVRRLVDSLGHQIEPDAFALLYRASGAEAERWWREEHRGYRGADRIHWLLGRLEISRPADCEHVARAVEAVDESLLQLPAPILPGAADAVRELARSFPLAIVSDTGFASGQAQDRLLARDGLLECFSHRIYSCDVGHTKPRREMFMAALDALGVDARDALHVGDLERTDVRGALAAGMRAIRLDVVRESGASAAETVARTFAELVRYVQEQ